jgi:hypothetical protein
MLLSVLICAVPSRMERMSLPLFRKLCDERAEVLLLLDNKQRTVGAKRNSLLATAQGDFVTFVDDDDDTTFDFVPVIIKAIEDNPDADCIVYDSLCSLDDEHEPRIVRSGIEFENTEYTHENGATRKPWHTMTYRRELIKHCRFADQQYGEDAVWAEQAVPLIKKQVRIDRVLHYYRWRADVTEAK